MKCTKPDCNCIEIAEQKNGGQGVKSYPCLGPNAKFEEESEEILEDLIQTLFNSKAEEIKDLEDKTKEQSDPSEEKVDDFYADTYRAIEQQSTLFIKSEQELEEDRKRQYDQMTLEEKSIRDMINEYYHIIEDSKKQIELRKIDCKCRVKENGNYSWRIGAYQQVPICVVCDKPNMSNSLLGSFTMTNDSDEKKDK